MSQALIKVTELTVDLGTKEPRIRDSLLAQRLGFNRFRDVRQLIERNIGELKSYGMLPFETVNSGIRGRPGKEYLLNEGQALVICALSRTDEAVEARRALIEVFMAWRRGQVVHVKEHRRRLPLRHDTNQYRNWTFEDVQAAIREEMRDLAKVSGEKDGILNIASAYVAHAVLARQQLNDVAGYLNKAIAF